MLADKGIGRLIVSGARTDECIRCTLHGAIVRGYDATLVSDAHTNLYRQHHRAPAAPRVR